MRIPPIVDRVTAVLAGNLNPAIFQPSWFALNKLASKEDATNAVVYVVHPELSHFDIGDLTIAVDKHRFSVTCPGQQHEMARDMLVGTFGNILTHTPAHAIGINREIHFDAGSFAIRNRIGDILAPKTAWGSWSEKLTVQNDDVTSAGGLVSIGMREIRKGNDPKGYIQAEIQPSVLAALRLGGIYMVVNNHYEVPQTKSAATMNSVIEIVDAEWTSAISKTEFVIDQIQTLAETLAIEEKRKL